MRSRAPPHHAQFEDSLPVAITSFDWKVRVADGHRADQDTICSARFPDLPLKLERARKCPLFFVARPGCAPLEQAAIARADPRFVAAWKRHEIEWHPRRTAKLNRRIATNWHRSPNA